MGDVLAHCVTSATHCFTRLRLVLKDPAKADKDALEGLTNVMKVVEAGGQTQIVIGDEVGDVYDEFVATYPSLAGGSVDAEEKEEDKGPAWQKVLNTIASVFTPTIPALTEHGWMPDFEPGDEDILRAGRPDYIGFNYYLTYAAEWAPEDAPAEYLSILKLSVPGRFRYVDNPYLVATEYGWAIDPAGFRRSLRELWQRYRLPLMITENGMGVREELSEDGRVHDSYRIDYLREHIREMGKAVAIDGVPVISYNAWTFIDVVSSSDDFSKRYGFVFVDRTETDEKKLARVPKDSFWWYQRVIATNGEDLC